MKKYIISAGVAAAAIASTLIPANAHAAGCISIDAGKACVTAPNGGVAIVASYDCGKLTELITQYLGVGEEALFNVSECDKIMLWKSICGNNSCEPDAEPVIITEDDIVTPAPATLTPVTQAPEQQPTQAPVPTQKPTTAPTQRPTAAPSQNTSSLSAMEQEVFRLVNEVRAQNGLGALTWAEDLARVARAHSSDMIARNFFDHTNPDGKSPFDRLRSNGISYRAAAENIAAGQATAEAVMNSWMNSSGHRANILNGSLKEIGVGAVKNSSGRVYWTQLFVSR